MSNKTTMIDRINESLEAAKIVKKYVKETADLIKMNSYGITTDWTVNEINQCVNKILRYLDGADYPYKLAKILKDEIFIRFDDYSSDWEERKNAKIQLERLMVLDRIIEKKVLNKEDLLPDEVRAFKDSFCAKDVSIEVRRSTYRIFLENRTRGLIDSLKKHIYEDTAEAYKQRQNNVIELYKLTEDLDIFSMGSKEESRKIVNKAWGIDDS